jgi:hypothetical protein
VSINNVAVTDEAAEIGGARPPHPTGLLLKRGKKTLAGVFLS